MAQGNVLEAGRCTGELESWGLRRQTINLVHSGILCCFWAHGYSDEARFD